MQSLADVEKSVYETILARRSVRDYQPRKVDDAALGSLLEAAVRAPTAMQCEPWAFVIIQDNALLLSISDRAKALYKAEGHGGNSSPFGYTIDNPDCNIFYNASTLILICGNRASPFAVADCWLAAENVMLAACAMGLGTCVIGYALPAFNDTDIREQLNITDDYQVVAPIVVGYQNGMTAQSKRKSPVILSKNIAIEQAELKTPFQCYDKGKYHDYRQSLQSRIDYC